LLHISRTWPIFRTKKLRPADKCLALFTSSADLFQVMQGVAGSFVVAAEQVHEKTHIPRGVRAWGRDSILLRLNVAESKHAQGLEESPRQVALAERERGLAGTSRCPRLAALDQKEAREILLVVFDAGLRILPPYTSAACRLAIPAASRRRSATTCLTLPAVS